jgi:hypothetical protein
MCVKDHLAQYDSSRAYIPTVTYRPGHPLSCTLEEGTAHKLACTNTHRSASLSLVTCLPRQGVTEGVKDYLCWNVRSDVLADVIASDSCTLPSS